VTIKHIRTGAVEVYLLFGFINPDYTSHLPLEVGYLRSEVTVPSVIIEIVPVIAVTPYNKSAAVLHYVDVLEEINPGGSGFMVNFCEISGIHISQNEPHVILITVEDLNHKLFAVRGP